VSDVTKRLRELIEDPEMGISNAFLREVLAYILSLERRLVDDNK
jgi:hypothetical protein